MPRRKAVSDPSLLSVPRGSLISICLFKGRYVCDNKPQAKRALYHALTLGISMDMVKDLKGNWVIFLSSRGVHDLRVKHGWRNPAMKERDKMGKRRNPEGTKKETATDEPRHPKRKVKVETVSEEDYMAAWGNL